MKKLGVIGGLGPMATAYFMEMMIDMTEADVDQDHMEMLIHNCPAIPDRTSYILGNSKENPLEKMTEVAKGLEASGAEVIAIPCVTATFFYEELAKTVSIPIINTIAETVEYLKTAGVTEVGLMATEGTVKSHIFQTAMETQGILVHTPSEERQKDVMHLIYKNVKASKPVEMTRFRQVSEELRQMGAQVILLGCTELSIIRENEEIGAGYLDVLQVLSKSAVETCAKLKPEYKQLITK